MMMFDRMYPPLFGEMYPFSGRWRNSRVHRELVLDEPGSCSYRPTGNKRTRRRNHAREITWLFGKATQRRVRQGKVKLDADIHGYVSVQPR